MVVEFYTQVKKFMSKKKLDVLLLARPDHSYTIYKGLLKSGLEFMYCSFKLMPQWLKLIVNNPRIRYYSKHYSNCMLLTMFHLYRVKYKKDSLEKYEKTLYESHLRLLLKKVEPRIIHYWPYFSLDVIKEYKKKHPEVKTFADVYFPCEFWVSEYIKPVLERNGLNNDMRIVDRDAQKLKKVMEFENNFLVPSKFVADTYKMYFPDKNYIIMSYGVSKWDGYKKKPKKASSCEIKRFVYAAGRLTIQKGCDYMLRYFKRHPELELHIYGSIVDAQRHIFEEYIHSENIFIHGHVPKKLLQEVVSQYDAGIHLSRYDAYSLAVGEMMGAGLPVIVSDKTGISSHVEEIGAGIITPLCDEAIENKMDDMRDVKSYNRFLDNLDTYLMSGKNDYENEIVEFYKQKLKAEL